MTTTGEKLSRLAPLLDDRGNVGAVDVRSFGVGTGETKENNTTNLQAAITHVQSIGGGFIDFPQGVFPFDPFTIPTGIVLRGAAPNHEAVTPDTGTVLEVTATAGGDGVTLDDSATSCGLRDITVRIANSVAVNSIVRSHGVSRPILKNVEAEYGNDGALNPGRASFNVSNAADNGSGLIRITTSAAHSFVTDNIVDVENVGGVTNANGPWKITVINTTTFDLQGSTFAGSYTSGGTASSLGAGFLTDTGTTGLTLYAELHIHSHTANSGLVLWDDSNAIGVSADSSIQGQYIPLRILGQQSFSTGFSCLGAIEGNYGAFGSTMPKIFVSGGLGIVDAVTPTDLYIVPLIEIQAGQGGSFPGGYLEMGGTPATFDDGTNGVHNLYPVVKLGTRARGWSFDCINRARIFDEGTETRAKTTGYKYYNTMPKPHFAARTNAAQLIASATNVAIDFSGQVLLNDDTNMSVSGDTITVYESGVYRVSMSVRFQAMAAATDFVFCRVVAGGVNYKGANNPCLINQEIGADMSVLVSLSRGDTIQGQVFHATGSNENLTADFESNYIMVEKI